MSAIAAAQAQVLITRVREEATRATDQMRMQAATESQSLRRQAREAARIRLRMAITEKRRRIEERCRAVDIECEQQRRTDRFSLASQLADRALARLPDALAARWQSPAPRQAWCDAALAIAARVLRGRDWTVEIATGVTAGERGRLEQLAAGRGAAILQWRESTAAQGLRIGDARTAVDATGARLLADRAALIAQFLAQLEHHAVPP